MGKGVQIFTLGFALLLMAKLAYGDEKHSDLTADHSKSSRTTPFPVALVDGLKKKVESISAKSPIDLPAPRDAAGTQVTDRKLTESMKSQLSEAVSALETARKNAGECEHKETLLAAGSGSSKEFIVVLEDYMTWLSEVLSGSKKMDDKAAVQRAIQMQRYTSAKQKFPGAGDADGDKNLQKQINRLTELMVVAGDKYTKIEWKDDKATVRIDDMLSDITREDMSEPGKKISAAVEALQKGAAKNEPYCKFDVKAPSPKLPDGGPGAVDPNKPDDPNKPNDPNNPNAPDKPNPNAGPTPTPVPSPAASYYPGNQEITDPNSAGPYANGLNPEDLIKSLLANQQQFETPPTPGATSPSGGGSGGGKSSGGGGGKPPGGDEGGGGQQGGGQEQMQQLMEMMAQKKAQDAAKRREMMQEYLAQQEAAQEEALKRPTPTPVVLATPQPPPTVNNDMLNMMRTMSIQQDQMTTQIMQMMLMRQQQMGPPRPGLSIQRPLRQPGFRP